MELKEFVQETILNIVNAVESTQKHLTESKSSSIVNPSVVQDGYIDYHKGKRRVIDVYFDVAVIVENKEEKNAEGSINIFQSIGIIGGKNKSKEDTNHSRISFSIPVLLPVKDNLTEEAIKDRKEKISEMSF